LRRREDIGALRPDAGSLRQSRVDVSVVPESKIRAEANLTDRVTRRDRAAASLQASERMRQDTMACMRPPPERIWLAEPLSMRRTARRTDPCRMRRACVSRCPSGLNDCALYAARERDEAAAPDCRS